MRVFTMSIDYVYKTKPFKHQEDVFVVSRDKEYFALLMEQGTGKTKVTIDTGCWLYNNGKIDAMLVIAPNGVHANWIINEIPAHAPDYCNVQTAYYRSQPNKEEEKALCKVLESTFGLKIIALNIEALVTQKGVNFVKNFLLAFKTMLIVDESSVIKSPKAQRTKNLLKLAVHSSYRRILTGTPVTQGPLDLFTQFSFLDQHILRTSSYYAFRNRYAIMKEMRTSGRSFQTVVGYTNLDELTKLIEPHSYRVTKSECLDLPDKLYSKRYVQLSDAQRKLYNQLKKDIVTEFNGMQMSAPLALTKLLRLQQIVGGFFVPDDEVWMGDELNEVIDRTPVVPQPIDKVNPRVESLIELLEEISGKVIIFARFRSEIYAISKRIKEEFGNESIVEYHGGIDSNTRSENIRLFQNDEKVKYFVGNTATAGKGLTLTAANTIVFWSNDFSLENRLQASDRAHRIGQKNAVLYIDFVAQSTIDEKIVETLRSKKQVADLITGDNIGEWL